MELSNPSFSKTFFSNQWLPYILINMVLTHRWGESTLFHDGMIALQILLTPGPQVCNLWKIAWLPSFIAFRLQRNVELYFTYNDGIYIFQDLTNVIESPCRFFYLDTDCQNNGAAYVWVRLIYTSVYSISFRDICRVWKYYELVFILSTLQKPC